MPIKLGVSRNEPCGINPHVLKCFQRVSTRGDRHSNSEHPTSVYSLRESVTLSGTDAKIAMPMKVVLALWSARLYLYIILSVNKHRKQKKNLPLIHGKNQ